MFWYARGLEISACPAKLTDTGSVNGARRRLWKVPPLLETRSDCTRVPTAAWKPAAPTSSHSPGGGLTRKDDPAGRVRVTLS